tara:strand:+ start:51 stop:644 length:594 start_codon:yes stop_codon:yes gene_type:complete
MAYIGKTPTAVPLTSGDITNGIITTAKIADDAISAAKLASGVGGKVLQVVQDTKLDTFSTTSTSYTDITGLSVAITPSLSSSKVLVMVSMTFSGADPGFRHSFQLLRGSTSIGGGTTAGNRVTAIFGNAVGANNPKGQGMGGFMYLDSPSTTSETTYKIQGQIESGGTLYVNRAGTDNDTTSNSRSSSTITVMEIGA